MNCHLLNEAGQFFTLDDQGQVATTTEAAAFTGCKREEPGLSDEDRKWGQVYQLTPNSRRYIFTGPAAKVVRWLMYRTGGDGPYSVCRMRLTNDRGVTVEGNLEMMSFIDRSTPQDEVSVIFNGANVHTKAL